MTSHQQITWVYSTENRTELINNVFKKWDILRISHRLEMIRHG
jgi:hypothetical protein